MLGGERRAVHAVREQRVAAVHHRGERDADVHLVDVAHHDLLSARLDAGLAQDGGEQGADPAGVADIGATDRLRDASEGDVALDRGHLLQLSEVDRDRVVHHAVDLQLPAG